MPTNYIIIFFISLFGIAFELFLTRILSLKTWNHLVYLIIPFALLGYGIGANIFLIFQKLIRKIDKRILMACTLFLIAIISVLCLLFLIRLDVQLEHLTDLFSNANSVLILLLGYSSVFIPFIPIGFLITYLFSTNPQESNKLYFIDLLGAGTGALTFVILINYLAIFRSILLLTLPIIFLIFIIICPKVKKIIPILFLLIAAFGLNFVNEPSNYAIDKKKGWEWIPGHYKKHQYETLVSQWHSLGRTDIYRIKDRHLREAMLKNAYFKINLSPAPEFA